MRHDILQRHKRNQQQIYKLARNSVEIQDQDINFWTRFKCFKFNFLHATSFKETELHPLSGGVLQTNLHILQSNRYAKPPTPILINKLL